MRGYSNREWLNPVGHPSTGSVVAYHGESPWDRDGKPDVMTILEISDCHGKVRLHRSEKDTLEEFIAKMEVLRGFIDNFVVYLKSEREELKMCDQVLAHLREARAVLLEERDSGKNSRELSVTLTEIDTAILWRQEDLRLKSEPINQDSA